MDKNLLGEWESINRGIVQIAEDELVGLRRIKAAAWDVLRASEGRTTFPLSGALKALSEVLRADGYLPTNKKAPV